MKNLSHRVRSRIGTATVILLIAAALWFILGPSWIERRKNPVFNPPPYDGSESTDKLHSSLFIADLHADSTLWKRDLLNYGTYGHIDIPRLRAGNVALQVFTVVTKVPMGQQMIGNRSDSLDLVTPLSVTQLRPLRTWGSLKERALYQSAVLHRVAQRSDGKFILVKSRQDLNEFVTARHEDPMIVAGLLGIEGAHCIEEKIENLKELFDAGFRTVGLSHFFDNELGGSAHGEQRGGLTPFGREVVKQMERLHMIIDLAHASPALIDDILRLVSRPVYVSHTGVKGTCNNPRNLSDDQLRDIALTGGVIGIGFWEIAVCGTDAAAIVDAIHYAVSLIGIDHVALGSDYDGAVGVPFDVSGISLITHALLQRDFSEEDIRKIMGENVRGFLARYLPDNNA